VLSQLPEPQRVVLHYLGGRVEAEVYLSWQGFGDSAAVRGIEHAISRCLAENPVVSSLVINHRRQVFPARD
jgi:hypothetical protein